MSKLATFDQSRTRADAGWRERPRRTNMRSSLPGIKRINTAYRLPMSPSYNGDGLQLSAFGTATSAVGDERKQRYALLAGHRCTAAGGSALVADVGASARRSSGNTTTERRSPSEGDYHCCVSIRMDMAKRVAGREGQLGPPCVRGRGGWGRTMRSVFRMSRPVARDEEQRRDAASCVH